MVFPALQAPSLPRSPCSAPGQSLRDSRSSALRGSSRRLQINRGSPAVNQQTKSEPSVLSANLILSARSLSLALLFCLLLSLSFPNTLTLSPSSALCFSLSLSLTLLFLLSLSL